MRGSLAAVRHCHQHVLQQRLRPGLAIGGGLPRRLRRRRRHHQVCVIPTHPTHMGSFELGRVAGRRPRAVKQSVACRRSAHGAHGALPASSQCPAKHSGHFRRSLRRARATGPGWLQGGETHGGTPAWSAALDADMDACMVQIPDFFCPLVSCHLLFWVVSFHSATNINAMGLMSS